MALEHHLSVPQPSEQSWFEVEGLGRFSLREIQDALLNTVVVGTDEQQRSIHREDSDCSWTHEEETGKVYHEMERRICDFVRNAETTMTTPFLTRRQRRFVHATAQVMQLGHASLGPQSKLRQMVVFKKEGTPVRETAEASREREGSGKKRKRLPKLVNGFKCQYPPCRKVFDRASERTKHEQSHQPQITHRFACDQCEKGFRYQKDLRRHRTVHNRTVETAQGSAYGSFRTSPTLNSESRVTSEASLTFSNQTLSIDNSPLFEPQTTSHANPDVSVDPLVLDENSWMPSAGGHEPAYDDLDFPGAVGLDFGGNDECDGDGDFLEMAIRKR